MSVGGENHSYVFDDAKRPALPYVPGACFEIKRHKRLAPFDAGISYEFPAISDLSEPLLSGKILPPSKISRPIDNLTPWRESPCKARRVPPKTITERYLRHRPRKTEPYNEDKSTRRLEIVSRIRVRDGAYAQVVQCRVDGIQGPLAAKIFDPLYRSLDVNLDKPTSPVGQSESEWSREAAAYERIQEGGLDGRYTPRFEGCWSFDIPWELELVRTTTTTANDTTTTGGPQSEGDGRGNVLGSSQGPTRRTIKLTRNVRLLLMEKIPGNSIASMLAAGAYRYIPKNVRMDLIARIAEAKSALWHINILHRDSHARNVVVGLHEEYDEADTDEDVANVDGAKEMAHNPTSSSLKPAKNEERPQKRPRLREPRKGGVETWHMSLIDFSRSAVLDLPNAKVKLQHQLAPAQALPLNPMTRCRGSWPLDGLRVVPRWTGADPFDMAEWIPEDLQSVSARHKWMQARWGKGSAKAHLYQPIDYDRLYEKTDKEKEYDGSNG